MTRIKNLPDSKLTRFIWWFYAIGLLGIGLPWTREFFIYLIPLNLLVVFGLLFIKDKSDLKILVPFGMSVFVAAFFVEVIGVKTGILFGDFTYGSFLGPKIFETPIFIGAKWLLLVYASTIVAKRITDDRYFIAVIATVLMVVFIFMIDFPATQMGLWTWDVGRVPMSNYLTWMALGAVLSGALQLLKVKLENSIAPTLFGVLMIFFVLLNLIFLFEAALS